MKYLFYSIFVFFLFVISVNCQPRKLVGFVETTHAMALKEVQYKPGYPGTSYSEAYYQISVSGPENSLIGNRLDDYTDRTEKYTNQCIFLIVNIPAQINIAPAGQNPIMSDYKVSSASLTAYLQNGSRVPGYTYKVGMLSPGDLIIKSSVNQYSQEEKIANRSEVTGMYGTSASYTDTITIPDVKSNVIPGGQTIVGIKAEGTNPMSAQIGFCCLTIMVEPVITINVANNFTGGKIRANVDSPSTSDQNAPVSINDVAGKTVYIDAVDNNNYDGSYYRVFNDTEAPLSKSEWWRFNGNGQRQSGSISSASTNFVISESENNWKYEAQMRKLCNVPVSLVSGSGNISGSLSIDNTNRNSPYTAQKVEGNNISLTVTNTYIQGPYGTYLDYYFDHWIVNGADNTTNTTLTTDINAHTTIEAYYKSKPTNGYRSMSFSGNAGDYITMNWSEHPDSHVNYRIYRKLYGETTGTLIATVNHGTTTYTDYDFTVADDVLAIHRISYDVHAVYSSEFEAAEDYMLQFGEVEASQNDNQIKSMRANILPTEFELGAYPNPFNPTTVIKYTMPEAGAVSLKVYNILSQEVASLVDETKSAGIHTVNFNASNLPTGIYIARLQAGSKVMSIKLQLMK